MGTKAYNNLLRKKSIENIHSANTLSNYFNLKNKKIKDDRTRIQTELNSRYIGQIV